MGLFWDGTAATSCFMPINMIKTAAGLTEIDQLIARQAGGKTRYKGQAATYAYTRYAPKQAAEIIASGGSIYWILRAAFRCARKSSVLKWLKKTTATHGAKSWLSRNYTERSPSLTALSKAGATLPKKTRPKTAGHMCRAVWMMNRRPKWPRL